ncbi:SRPBCC domain-containing protein [bacterium BMS3Abin03]|nr:SRPBCC domain-containing protein [bacterium BMS3Abin03]MCG6959570.1 SRPBCC domain-containing protein [bacterium BMS3Abin03]
MPAIKHYLVINSTTKKIYNAFTTKTGITNWWTSQTEIGSKIGDINIFNFGTRYHNEMSIADLQPNKRVEWKCIVGDKEWIGTNFVFELEEKDKDTILRFSHYNWNEETDFFASCNYQWAYYLGSLKQYCETGIGTPFKG